MGLVMSGAVAPEDIDPEDQWIALLATYVVIFIWFIFFVLTFWRIARGEDSRGIVAPSMPDRCTHPLEDLASLDESCFLKWRWRAASNGISESITFKVRLALCCLGLALTTGTIVVRIIAQGDFFKGLAEQWSYLTQWGIMLSTIYYGAACLYYRVHRIDLVSRRILVALQTLSLCVEVTIFIMWLTMAMDVNVHEHVLAPAAIVIEFKCSRLPLYFRDVSLLIVTLVLYLLVNYTTTKYWFVVYPGAITYSTRMTVVYIFGAMLIATFTLIICKFLRRTEWIFSEDSMSGSRMEAYLPELETRVDVYPEALTGSGHELQEAKGSEM